MKQTYDVIVIGGGGSGLAAAVSAAQHGGSVLVLEKQPQLGGTTGIAVGSFTAAKTRLQQQAGIADDVNDHCQDAGRFAHAEIESHNNAALREFFLSEAAATLGWLQSLGMSFVGPRPEPPNRVPRMHNIVPGAKAYISSLQLALQQHGGEILCRASAKQLIQDDQGRVTGVLTKVSDNTTRLQATRGVILAAGDYANNSELIAQYKGQQFRQIEGINPHATGDGHLIAEAVGAKLINMNITYGPELRFVASSKRPFQQWLPAHGLPARWMGIVAHHLPKSIMNRLIKRLLVTWQHPEDSLFDDGAILINQNGQRFVDETKSPERELGVADQPGKRAYILLDARLIDRYSAWPRFISTAPDIAYAYVKDYLRLRPDVSIQQKTIEELAAARSVDSHRLRASIAQFNDDVRNDKQDVFGRTDDRHELKGPPWVLLGPVKSYFTTTEGGVAVDRRLQALDNQGNSIPGLYAVGQNGIGGMVLWGHGLHIAWAMTSGRLAGQSIMQPIMR